MKKYLYIHYNNGFFKHQNNYGGMSMYFEERGNNAAPTILFIHGGGISSWMWEKQLEYFKDYHCIVVDLPEHGKNFNKKHISISNSAEEIAKLIEKYGNGGKAHIVGHSLGAKIIIELLSKRSYLASSAIVASALFRPIPLMKLTHKPFYYKLTSLVLKSRWITAITAKQFKFPNQSYRDSFIKDFQGLRAETLYRIYDELYNNLSLPEGLERVDVPVLVIAGEKEPDAMIESVSDMIKVIPNARGGLVRKGLHTYPWVMYGVFNKILEAWINNKEVEDDCFFYINRK